MDDISRILVIMLIVVVMSACVQEIDMGKRINRVLLGILIGFLLVVLLKEAGNWAFPTHSALRPRERSERLPPQVIVEERRSEGSGTRIKNGC